mmetsp:Transcript_57475/g.69147  ORF Transcript_57475/g.69147 Transcript_57475/m.69147 type:complete len:238 (+) Transcript_57475:107-820(+)
MNYNRVQNDDHKPEAIVHKLHEALARFRREKDDLHRKKVLALERLRLAWEERESVEKCVQSMQSKLDSLTKSVKSVDHEDSNGVSLLRNKVDRLVEETKFQHAELVAKRNKCEKYKLKVKDDIKLRSKDLMIIRESIRKRRTMVANFDCTHRRQHEQPFMDIQISTDQGATCQDPSFKDSARKIMEMDDDILMEKLPRLVEEKASAISSKVEDLHRASETLKRRRDGYRRYLGISAQ